MTRPLRVGLLFEYPSLNGGEYSLLAVLKELGDQVQCLALAPAGRPIESALKQLSIETHDWDARATTDHELTATLASLPVDLWHANSLAMSRRLGRIADTLALPTSGHFRDILKLSARAMGDLNQLRQVICVSAATRDFHIVQGLSAERSCVVYNGIDLDRFTPSGATGVLHTELPLPPSAKVVLNVGQICLRKGQETFIKVALELAKQDGTLHFVHCGARHSTKAESIAFEAQLDADMRDAGLAERWHRLGIRDDMPDVLRAASLLLHCARQEPLGRVLLEALACGTPVVATRVGGTPEILRDGQEGLLAEPDDVDGLVAASRRLLDDEELRSRITQQGRSRCESLFSVERAAQETLAIWHSLRSPD